MPKWSARHVITALAVLIGVGYTYAICAKGIPALRHDWSWIADPSSFRANLIDASSGWSNYGFGGARPYPIDYAINLAFYIMSWLVGPFGVLAVFGFLTGALMAYSADAIVRACGTVSLANRAGATLVASFNPWCYNQIVAGHVAMIFALAGLGILVARTISGRWKLERDIWALLVALSQLQFFLFAIVFAVVIGLRQRDWKTPLTSVVLFLPVIIGVAFERTALVATPYLPSWQVVQSVPLFRAVVLDGYYAGYADVLGMLSRVGTGLLFAAVLLSVWRGWQRTPWQCAGLAAGVLLLWIAGFKGPLSAVYARLTELPASGVYRELYDLVGIVILCYLVMIGCAGTLRPLRLLVPAAGLLLVFSWVLAPPSRFWVASSRIPALELHAEPFTRYALYPAFQPLSLGLGGSGADPDALLRAYEVDPLNEYLPLYPGDAALARYASTGDASDLEALNVSQAICRPYLRSLGDALSAAGVPRRSTKNCVSRTLHPIPRIALSSAPVVVSGLEPLGWGNIEFGSAMKAESPQPTPSLDASHAWISVRFVERAQPSVANPFGGIYTTSQAPFAVPAGRWFLGFGKFADERTLTSPLPSGFTWRFHARGSWVRCESRACAIALISSQAPQGETPIKHRWAPLAFRSVFPWLIAVNVPARSRGQLLFDERYDAAWAAIAQGALLRHVAVDGVINSWILTAKAHMFRILLIEIVALFQALAEAIAIVWVLVLTVPEIRRLVVFAGPGGEVR